MTDQPKNDEENPQGDIGASDAPKVSDSHISDLHMVDRATEAQESEPAPQSAEQSQPAETSDQDAVGSANDGNPPGEGVQAETVGCGPAIVAGTLLMGIVAFVLCAFTTWLLFSKRTEFASRTLQGYVPMVEQSLLEPDEKQSVIDQLDELVKEMRDPNYDPAQAGAIMERIVRLPIPHWGELAALDSFVSANFDAGDAAEATKQLSRIREAVRTSKATVFDLIDVLDPVSTPDDSQFGRRFQQPLQESSVREVIKRAKLLADRDKIPDETFGDTSIASILRKEIAMAKSDGGF